jgi:hypothetical protein
MSKPTHHSAASYAAKYLTGGNANINRLLRWLRMRKQEAKR